jgi:hypothetical protein
MGLISEQYYCAGWMSGNEFRLRRALNDKHDDLSYRLGVIQKEQVEELRMLSHELQG